jgi:hypothetical protein
MIESAWLLAGLVKVAELLGSVFALVVGWTDPEGRRPYPPTDFTTFSVATPIGATISTSSGGFEVMLWTTGSDAADFYILAPDEGCGCTPNIAL